MYNKTYVEYGELWHHGILGQKWGVRRYQNADGTWTDRGKKMRRDEDAAAAKDKASKEKQAAKAAKKSANADKATQKKIQRIRNEKIKAEQDRIHKIKTGDLKTIQEMQRKGQLSNQELQEAINRLRLQNQLSELGPKKKTVFEKLSSAGQKVQTVANFVNAGKNAVNAVQSFSDILNKNKSESNLDALRAKGKGLVSEDILSMASELSTAELQDSYNRLGIIYNLNKARENT